MTLRPYWISPSLYELAHIDRERYTILAIDLIVDGPGAATIYAVDRVEQGISLHAEIVELGQREGEIPVVQFDLAEPGVEEFIRKAFKRISVRLVAQHLRDQVLVVAKSSRRSPVDLIARRTSPSSAVTRECPPHDAARLPSRRRR